MLPVHPATFTGTKRIAHGTAKRARKFHAAYGNAGPSLRVAASARRPPEWTRDGARKTFASAHYKIHREALKTAYELGHRGTNILLTHYNQNMRKEEAVRFWSTLPPCCMGATKAVKTYQPNSFGLFDMAGHVSEWCWNATGETPAAPAGASAPSGPDRLRVHRGGGWNATIESCRVHSLEASAPHSTGNQVGFKIVRKP
jgi:hypothetical protein